MATGDLIFADSLQHSTMSAGGVPPKWNSNTATSATFIEGMFGADRCLVMQSGNAGNFVSRTLGANYASGTISCYWRTATLAAGIIIAVGDAGTVQCEVRVTATGALTVTRNGTVLATSANTVSVDTPYHIEFLVTVHNSAGTYEVKVNGSSSGWIAAATGANTRNGSNNFFNEARIYSNGLNTTSNHRYAHFKVVEGLSSFGPALVVAMHPSGAGNVANFVPNYASNWFNASDPINDDDTSFNQSAVDTDKDSFAMTDAPSGTVEGVQASIRVRQDAGSGHTIRAFLRIAGTNYNGSAKTVGATYASLTWVWTTNPATGVAWTTSDLASVELGYERVS